MRSAPRALCAVVIASVLILTGCSSRNFAYNVDESDLSGVWVQESRGHSMSLVISMDGTFEASSWPRNLLCSATSAKTTEDLDWGERVDFGGSWRSVSPDLTYALVFSIESGDCDRTGWTSNVWSDESGELDLKIFLDSVTDADSASEEQVLWLRKSE